MNKSRPVFTEEFPFSLSPERSYKEIMGRSCTYVDDYTLGLQFPACDFGSYYLYAVISGDGPCQAINLGLTIGHDTGSNVNIPQLKGDPGGVWIVTSLIFENKSYRSFDFDTYKRADAVYSRQGLDVRVGGAAAVKGSWPYFEMYFNDRKYDIVYKIQGKAGYAHWVPDHVSTTMAYSYLLFPDFKFRGSISVSGKSFDITGTGSLDHVFGRNVNNPSGTVIGFWHADPVIWEENMVSNGLYYLDDKGKPYIASGVMTVPDGGYHPAELFEVQYLEIGRGTSYSGLEAGSQIAPRRWRAKMRSEHGILSYETKPVKVFSPESGAESVEPCVLSMVQGQFEGNNGKIIRLKGKCYNEYESGVLDPKV